MMDDKVGEDEAIRAVIGHHVDGKRINIHVQWTGGGIFWYVPVSNLLKDEPKMLEKYVCEHNLWNELSNKDKKALKAKTLHPKSCDKTGKITLSLIITLFNNLSALIFLLT